MTLHTPVVITDDEATAAEARRRHWPVVRRDGDTLRLTGVGQTAPLPEPRMDIAAGSLNAEHAAGWKFVLDWIAKHVHRPMVITAPDGWAHELALWSAASRGWPQLLVERLDDLPSEALIDVVAPVAPGPSVRRPGTTRVLLVAHDLASERTAGWFRDVERASGGDVTLDLATARPAAGSTGRVHFVPDFGIATLAPATGPVDAVTQVALAHAVEAPFDPIREPAGAWQLALERHFEARDDHYDVVVLAGPPFGHFGFAAWAQRNWYARVVLDYGHPFGTGLQGEADQLARYWERGWNMAADVVTVPHAADEELVERSGPEARVEALGDEPAELANLCRELGDHTYTRD